MPRMRFVVLSFTVMVLQWGTVFGQEYPNKPIRIFTASPGGGSDFVTRQISQEIAAPLGQPVIIENRGGIIPAETVAKAPPDGYTLLVDSASFWVAPLLQKMPYDVLRDFSPVTLVTASPHIMVVHPSVPAKSVKELIALAKAKPGELNYASVGAGGSAHLATEFFKSLAGIDVVRINYKSAGASATALVGGEVQLLIASSPVLAPHISSGRLRILAIGSARPSALFPGVPTVSATVPGYETVTNTGVLAPAKTPTPIIERLNQEIVRVLNRGDVKERFLKAGSDVIASSPEQFSATVKSEIAKWGKVIKDAGIRVD